MKCYVTAVLTVAAVVLCTARPASASFIYDWHLSGASSGEVEFVSNTLIASLTTVTSFIINTGKEDLSNLPVVSLEFNPNPNGADCTLPGPITTSPGFFWFFFSDGHARGSFGLTDFSAVGSYILPDATLTITEGAVTVPEPSPLPLLITALGATLVTRLRAHRSAK